LFVKPSGIATWIQLQVTWLIWTMKSVKIAFRVFP